MLVDGSTKLFKNINYGSNIFSTFSKFESNKLSVQKVFLW